MDIDALIMMIATQAIVTGVTIWFFIKVLRKPVNKEGHHE